MEAWGDVSCILHLVLWLRLEKPFPVSSRYHLMRWLMWERQLDSHVLGVTAPAIHSLTLGQ